MAVLLVVGINSYETLAEADAYLDGSIAAAVNWKATAPDTKRRSLISAFRLLEKQTWEGEPTGIDLVSSFAIASGGTGHAVGDLLTVVGGSLGVAAVFRVKTIAAGVITAVEAVHAGVYLDDDIPTNPVATTSSGAGAGATLTLSFIEQEADHPRTGMSDCDGTEMPSDDYAQPLKDAQSELAYLLSQDPDLMTSGGIGSNVRRAKAGSAEVEFFRATGGVDGTGSQRFPPVVHELIRCLLDGSAVGSFGLAVGTEGESLFSDYPGTQHSGDFSLSEGF